MKTMHSLLIGLMATTLLGACSAPTDQGTPTASPAAAPTPASAQSSHRDETPAKHASTTGTIEAIDPAASTITIAHGPVPALAWPAMTMTFQAPDVDLASFAPGDRVAFELSAAGMTATVTALKHE